MEVLLSESQAKLAALLDKAKEVLLFSTDAECEDAFRSLASFASASLSHKREPAVTKFQDMDLEALLKLAEGGEFSNLLFC